MQKITFTTNTGRNTLEHLKLLLLSLQINLDNKDHEILVFVDADNEDTVGYLQGIKSHFKDLKIIQNRLPFPVGYQRNKTLLTEYASHDIISYLQSDMVVGPHYDTEILQHVKKGRILSSTRVEPPLHGESPVTFTKNLGLTPEEFSLEAWNEFSPTVKREELVNYFFAPITYYKDDWMKLGGYDTAFRRSREDSDLVQRCVHAGIELVQTFSANVYHFTCVSSRGSKWFDQQNNQAQDRVKLQQKADVIELRKFIRKWGSFNHGEKQLFKLDTDLVPKNYTLQDLANLEPFFSRVWINTEEERQLVLQEYETSHIVANTLLNVSDHDWLKYKHLFRNENFEEIFKVGEPEEYSIKIAVDCSKLSNSNQFITNLQNLYDLLHTSEVGEYELDGVLISIKNIKVLESSTLNNPPFDYNILNVI